MLRNVARATRLRGRIFHSTRKGSCAQTRTAHLHLDAGAHKGLERVVRDRSPWGTIARRWGSRRHPARKAPRGQECLPDVLVGRAARVLHVQVPQEAHGSRYNFQIPPLRLPMLETRNACVRVILGGDCLHGTVDNGGDGVYKHHHILLETLSAVCKVTHNGKAEYSVHLAPGHHRIQVSIFTQAFPDDSPSRLTKCNLPPRADLSGSLL